MLSPIETLYDDGQGDDVPLGKTLTGLYGTLRFPSHGHQPYVISNFVSTLDGVVTLGIPGHAGGDDISGKNRHDSAVMGILRAVSDVVIVGSRNLAASREHIWTAEHVFAELAQEYHGLRKQMAKASAPLNVIVTAHAGLDLTLPIFQSGKVNVLIVTTAVGAKEIEGQKLPAWVRVGVAGTGPKLSAGEIIGAIVRAEPASRIILVEGGPHLLETFIGNGALDELFLTLSPQIAGRVDTTERLGLVAGRLFAPENQVWAKLAGLKKAGNHLFLRYRFPARK